jgi:hypothetical protein
MTKALDLEKMDQIPFIASSVHLADMGSPMQQDEGQPIVPDNREQELAAIPVPTPEELAKAVSYQVYGLSRISDDHASGPQGYDITERMTAFNQANYPENYARCKQLYHFGRKHITQLLGDIPMESYEDKEAWNRKAREFMLGCEEVHNWLDEQDLNDEDWVSDDGMEIDHAVNVEKEAKDGKDSKGAVQLSRPSAEAK